MIGQERWQTLPASSRLNLRRQGVLMVHELNTQKIQRYRVEEAEVPLILGVGDFSGEHAQRAATIFGEEAKRGRVVRLLGAKHDAPMSHPEQIAGLIGAAVRQISKLL
jgi:pimeloyl-ACP methyl ester carboxylesterase